VPAFCTTLPRGEGGGRDSANATAAHQTATLTWKGRVRSFVLEPGGVILERKVMRWT
jgi:hypothetical protein